MSYVKGNAGEAVVRLYGPRRDAHRPEQSGGQPGVLDANATFLGQHLGGLVQPVVEVVTPAPFCYVYLTVERHAGRPYWAPLALKAKLPPTTIRRSLR